MRQVGGRTVLTVVVAAVVVAAGCATAPSQRQASRVVESEAAAAIIDRVEVPVELTVVEFASIRTEYPVTGVATGDDIVVRVAAPIAGDLRPRHDVTFSRDDGVGGVEAAQVTSVVEPGRTDTDERYTVRIDSPIDDATGPIPIGTELSIVLFGTSRPPGLLVDAAALRFERDQAFVVVQADNGERRRVDVERVTQGAGLIEVTGDLMAGETMVVP